MGLKVQVVYVSGEPFFVCNATGALIKHRYFIPGKQRHGVFISLPIALRWLRDSCKLTKEQFDEIKTHLCAYFMQPDIPLHPKRIKAPVPYDVSLKDIVSELTMGESWLLVDGSESIEDYLSPKKPDEKGSFEAAWLTLFN